MPISDSYIIQYLLQETRDGGPSVVWREAGSEEYTTSIRDMRIELHSVHSRAGARLYLSIVCARGRIHIEEPPNIGFFRKRYRSESQRYLAEMMEELARSVGRQCDKRRRELSAGAEDIRQTVYRRLIGVSPTGG
jgi:hypothetical protein